MEVLDPPKEPEEAASEAAHARLLDNSEKLKEFQTADLCVSLTGHQRACLLLPDLRPLLLCLVLASSCLWDALCRQGLLGSPPR